MEPTLQTSGRKRLKAEGRENAIVSKQKLGWHVQRTELNINWNKERMRNRVS
jgi:hypothetical protein